MEKNAEQLRVWYRYISLFDKIDFPTAKKLAFEIKTEKDKRKNLKKGID